MIRTTLSYMIIMGFLPPSLWSAVQSANLAGSRSSGQVLAWLANNPVNRVGHLTKGGHAEQVSKVSPVEL